MKISALNNCNLYSNNYKSNVRFSGDNNAVLSAPIKISKIPPIVILGVAATMAVIKGGSKLKNTVEQIVKKHKNKGYITIPISPKSFELDTTKLRRLPAEIKTQAIEALNKARTMEEKTEIIKKFAIAR